MLGSGSINDLKKGNLLPDVTLKSNKYYVNDSGDLAAQVDGDMEPGDLSDEVTTKLARKKKKKKSKKRKTRRETELVNLRGSNDEESEASTQKVAPGNKTAQAKNASQLSKSVTNLRDLEQKVGGRQFSFLDSNYNSLVAQIVEEQLGAAADNVSVKNNPLSAHPGVRTSVAEKSVKSFKDNQSMRSMRSTKTIMTSKNRQVKNLDGNTIPVSPTRLPVVGLEKPQQPEREKVMEAVKMLDADLGTEQLVKNILEYLKEQDEEAIEWPVDAVFNPQLKKSLSYSKMINELNHREPRQYSLTHQVEPIPICGSTTGCHCSLKRCRKSTVKQLGPGINLYLKMLKFFASLFLVFALMSIPTYLIYYNNNNLDARSPWPDQLQMLSLGTMSQHKRV